MDRLNMFKNAMCKDNKSEKTIQAYCSVLSSYFNWLDSKYGEDTTDTLYRQNIVEYIEYLKLCNLSPKTINAKITALKKYGELMQPDTIVIKNNDYLKIDEKETISIDISKKEVDCFLQRVLYTKSFHSLRDYTIIYIMAYEGLYLSEVLEIKKQDINLSNYQIVLRDDMNNLQKSIDIERGTLNVIKSYIESMDNNNYELLFCNSKGERLNNTTINHVFDTYDFGNKKITPTKLRQFYYINAFEEGKSLEDVKKHTGATTKTLLKYINYKKDVVKQQYALQKTKQKTENVKTNTEKSNGYVYFISDGRYVKIGVATGTVEERLKTLQTGNPNKLIVLNSLLVDNPFEVEANYHLLFKNKHVNGEWFDILDVMDCIC